MQVGRIDFIPTHGVATDSESNSSGLQQEADEHVEHIANTRAMYYLCTRTTVNYYCGLLTRLYATVLYHLTTFHVSTPFRKFRLASNNMCNIM